MPAKCRSLAVLAVSLALMLGVVPAFAFQVEKYERVSTKRIDRTTYEYSYKIHLNNTGDDAFKVTARLTDIPAALVVLDGELSFGNVAAGATVVSADTFTIVYERRSRVTFDALQWEFESVDPTEEPLLELNRFRRVRARTISDSVRETTYRGRLKNFGVEIANATATIITAPPGMTVVDGDLSFGSLGTDEQRLSEDTFVVRHAPGQRFSSADIEWDIQFEVPNTGSEAAVAQTQTLDGVGHPLGNVNVVEVTQPAAPIASSEPETGLVTLGRGGGDFLWRFEKEHYLPVWRKANVVAGEVTLLHSPWLAARNPTQYPVSVLNGGTVGDPDEWVTVGYPAGAVPANTNAQLTELNGQSLPGLLPAGYSPLNAFWLEFDVEPSGEGTAHLRLMDVLLAQEGAVFARWDEQDTAWQVLDIISGDDGDRYDVLVPGSGAYAVVVADVLPVAPPAPVIGEALALASAMPPPPETLNGTGSVDPAVSTASTDPGSVTAEALVEITHNEPLSSGLVLRTEIDERYLMNDASEQRLARFSSYIVGYQRPGDRDPRTLQARFPMRPRLLLGPDLLREADISAQILTPEAFSGGVIGSAGGRVSQDGIVIDAAPGVFDTDTPIEVRSLEIANFIGLVGEFESLIAFELLFTDLADGRELLAQFPAQAPNSNFVLARVVARLGEQGLQPIARYASDDNGQLTFLESLQTPALHGITAAGQYVLVKVDAPVTVVEGTAQDTDGIAGPGLLVRVDDSPWLALTDENGRYFQVSRGGPTSVVVIDPVTGDRGSVVIDVGAGGSLVDVNTVDTGPRVVDLVPADGATNVDAVTPVQVRFSEPIVPISLGPNGLVLRAPDGSPVEAALSLNQAANQIDLLPTVPLAYGTAYTVELTNTVRDANGNMLEGANQFSFSTEAQPTRQQGAQLISHEPGSNTEECADVPGFQPGQNGISCVYGTSGAADAEVPVIIINETTGETATVLSKPDGSFKSFVAADVDDFISATFVNANGTRINLPLSRQLFDDGGVALFQGGGILEAENEEAGKVQVLVEPKAIPNKTKFKLELSSDLQELLARLKETPPENAQLLGGLDFEITGDELEESADIIFPVDPSELDLAAGENPEARSFVLTQPIEIDGTVVYSIVDSMTYNPETESLETASPPFEGIINFGRFLLTPLMLPVFKDQELTVVGRVIAAPAEIVDNLTEQQIFFAQAPLRRVSGAIVSADLNSVSNTSSNSLRAGAVVARANKIGFFALRIPFNPISGSPIFLRAQNPLFPARKAASGTISPTIFTGVPEVVQNLIFKIPSGNTGDGFAPLVTATQATSVLPINGGAIVKLTLQDDTSTPTLDDFTFVPGQSTALAPGETIDSVEIIPDVAQPISATAQTVEVEINMPVSAVATFIARVSDDAGNSREVPIQLRFGLPPDPPPTDLQPYDDNDSTPPRVVSVSPGRNTMIAGTRPVIVRFSEAISELIENEGISIVGDDGEFAEPTVTLSEDQLSITISTGTLDANTDYTLSVLAQDLAGNVMSNTFVSTFFTPPSESWAQTGIDSPIATTVHAGYSFNLDRGATTNTEALVVHALDDPSVSEPVGNLNLPPYPRAILKVTDWNYVLEPGGAVRNSPLLIVSGGLLGAGQVGPWMWVIDISDPTNPQRIASELVNIDISSAISRLRWATPFVALGDNTPEGGRILFVNLQAFLLGGNGFTNPGDYVFGVDADANGDFVGSGDSLPIPRKGTLWGHERTISSLLAPNTPARRRVFYDFDTALRGLLTVAIMRNLNDIPARLQVLQANGLDIGDGEGANGGYEYPLTGKQPFRVVIDPSFPIHDEVGERVAPVAIVSFGDELDVIDLTDPFNPTSVGNVWLPDNAGKIFGIERADAGHWAVGTNQAVYLIDRTKMTLAANEDLDHPAISAILPASFGFGRSFGIDGISLAVPTGTAVRRPPLIQTVIAGTGTFIPREQLVGLGETTIKDYVSRLVEQTILLPVPVTAGPGQVSVLDETPSPAYHNAVRIEASGSLGPEIKISIAALTRGGNISRAQGPRYPPVFLSDDANSVGLEGLQPDGSNALTASRLSANPTSELYNVYLSDPFVVIREGLGEAELEALAAVPGRKSIWAGERLRISLESVDGSPWGEAMSSQVNGDEYEAGISRSYEAFCGQFIDAPNPATRGAAGVVAGVDVQSGEFRHLVADARLQSRSVAAGLTRSYQSRAHYVGPFGRGWDFNLNTRVCAIPTTGLPAEYRLPITLTGDPSRDRIAQPGDVLWNDGQGGVYLFRRIDAAHFNLNRKSLYDADPAIEAFGWSGKIASYYDSPPGLFSVLYRFTDGSFVLIDQSGQRLHFFADGRVERAVGIFPEAQTRYAYRADGKLDAVINDRNREIKFGYFGRSTSPEFVNGQDRPYGEVSQIGLVGRIKTDDDDIEYNYDGLDLVEVMHEDGTDQFYGYDEDIPFQLTSIRTGSIDGPALQTVGYQNGLVINASLAGRSVSFSGSAATAAERTANGTSDVAFSLADGAAGQSFSVDAGGRPTGSALGITGHDNESRLTDVGQVNAPLSLEYDDENSNYRFRGNLRFIRQNEFVTETTYDQSAWNRVDTITTPEGVLTDYSYSPEDMTAVSGTHNVEWRIGPVVNQVEYDIHGQLKTQRMSEAGTTFDRTIIYDSNDLPSAERVGGLISSEIGLSSSNISSFTSFGLSYTAGYDAKGQLESLSGANLPSFARSYHESGLPASDTFAGGGKTVSESYTFEGDTARVQSSTHTESGLPDVETMFSYNDGGVVDGWTSAGETVQIGREGKRITSFTAPNVSRDVTYDDQGRVTSVTEQGMTVSLGYNNKGQVDTYTQRGGTWGFTFGNGKQVESKTVTDAQFGQLHREQYGYDAAGRVDTIITPHGTYGYDYFPDEVVRSLRLNGQLLREIERDEGGRITRVEMPGLVTRFENFDSDNGQPATETLLMGGGATLEKSLGYDAQGNLETITTPLGTYTVEHDFFGNPVRFVDPDGVAKGYSVSPQGAILAARYLDGTEAPYIYEGNARVKSIGDMVYSVVDGVTQSVTYPDGTQVSFDRVDDPYNPDLIIEGGIARKISRVDGAVTRIEANATGDAIDVTQDAYGRPRFLTRTSPGLAGTDVLEFNFDSLGNFTEQVSDLGTWSVQMNAWGALDVENYPSGLNLLYQPGNDGLPTQILGAEVDTVSWWGPGLPKTIEYGGGVNVSFTLDDSLRITRIEYQLADAEEDDPALAGFVFQLSPGGRMLSETRLHEGRSDVFQRNAPAAGMRITGYEMSATDTTGTNASALVGGFDFDGNGEIISPTQTVGPDVRAFFPTAQTDGYRLTLLDGQTVAYNSAGAVEQISLWIRLPGASGLTRVQGTLNYDGFGMLRDVVRDDGCTVAYERDAWGRIIKRAVSGPPNRCTSEVRQYAWRGPQLIEEYVGDGAAPLIDRRYVYLGDRLVRIQVNTGNGLENLIPLVGLNGSIGGYLAEDGTLIETILYGPYGLPVFRNSGGGERSDSAVADSLLFHGAWFDVATGLYEMGSRNLHPLTGRFLQRDAAMYATSRAMYTAFNGDPATSIDRNGTADTNVSDLAVSAVSELAKAPLKDYESMKGAISSSGAALADAAVGGSKFTAGMAVADLIIKGTEMGAKLFPEEKKTIDAAVIKPWKDLKGIADIYQGFHKLRQERLLITAIRADILTKPTRIGEGMRWLKAGGAMGDLRNLGPGFWASAKLEGFTDDFNKLGYKAARAKADLNYRHTRFNLKFGIAKGVFGLGKYVSEAVFRKRNGKRSRTGNIVMNAADVIDGGLKITEAVIAARQSMDTARLASALGPKAAMAGLSGFTAVANVQLAWSGGQQVGTGLMYLLYAGFSDADAYEQDYGLPRRQFAANGGYLTTFSGVLSSLGDSTGIGVFDEAAYSLQQFNDNGRRSFALSEAWQSTFRDYDVRLLYLNGID